MRTKEAGSKIRWSDGLAKKSRLKLLAQAQGVSINRLVNQWADIAIAQADSRAAFQAAAARGSIRRALRILDKLDADDSRRGIDGTLP